MDLRYPIGLFTYKEEIDSIEKWIQEIEELPTKLKVATENLNEEQLNTPYRPGGWTVRQVVHHVADSHINSYTRFKLALTEENPTIKPYMEEKWAELSDSQLPIEVSLTLLESLHTRWTHLLRSLSAADLEKAFYHPDTGATKLKVAIGLYAWHGKHHTAHIATLANRLGW
ncbi:metal-dependent hydrolase [Bacillus manliponensis]|uniref:Putative metal-dependent hydrolase BAMA_03875 n=1 Tax=Bacillus manliponensis TaxID=574376 RepID=A0A073JUD2_9BACI|nr:bacillithiol transferase BstA [Bacillus manliponensis]KEK18654.1 metal-dependent hydrolase [Bacillus manliponensis]